jgi:hypothetical protein
MERSQLLEEVKTYFAASDHWRRLCCALQDPDPEGTHVHSYVDTSVHPDSLEAIMCGYFERLGYASSRKIDHMSPNPAAGMGSLHGVEPQGKPHFDFQWFFKEDVGLQACNGGESGCNLLIWNRWYINQFNNQFPYREVGPEEEAAIEAYFRSDHFVKGLEFPVMPTTCHMHINVNSGVHPDYLQKYAEPALAREGIKIYYTCPNVYLGEPNKYRGKLVFMSQDPEVVFDIGWKFTPGVVVEPAMENWIMQDNPGYDVWTTDMLEKVMDAPYVTLTDAEIDDVLAACVFP